MFSSDCLKHSGFVFTMDILIAVILVAAFLPTATLQKLPEDNYLTRIELKQLSGDIANSLEGEQGENSAMAILDDLDLSDEEKAQLIYDKISGMLPKNIKARIELKKYAPLISASCRTQQTFQTCFPQPPTILPSGFELPSNQAINHEKILLVRKSRSGECTWGES